MGRTDTWMLRLRLVQEQTAAVATEYGLILMLIALVLVAALTAFGIAVAGMFQRGAAGIPTGS